MTKRKYATKASPEEIATFFDLRNEGVSVAEAARRLNRSPSWAFGVERKGPDQVVQASSSEAHGPHADDSDANKAVLAEQWQEQRLIEDGLALIAGLASGDVHNAGVLWSRYAGKERTFARGVAMAAGAFAEALATATDQTTTAVAESVRAAVREQHEKDTQELRDELACSCDDCTESRRWM